LGLPANARILMTQLDGILLIEKNNDVVAKNMNQVQFSCDFFADSQKASIKNVPPMQIKIPIAKWLSNKIIKEMYDKLYPNAITADERSKILTEFKNT
jgi:hypothetical protein